LPDPSSDDVHSLDAIVNDVLGIKKHLATVLENHRPCFDSVAAERFAPNKTFERQGRFYPHLQKSSKRQKVSKRLLIGPSEQEACEARSRLLSQTEASNSGPDIGDNAQSQTDASFQNGDHQGKRKDQC
jgi:hypothetical protein